MRTTWDLEQLYKSADDPQMEKDVKALERVFSAFAKKYRGAASYARSEAALARALGEYEAMLSKRAWGKPLSYFQFRLSLDSGDAVARAKLNQLMERLTKSYNQIIFFELSLMKIPPKLQKRFLKSPRLERYRHFLKTIFARAAHTLSEAEEKIMSLKEIPAYQQWIDATDKLLGRQTVESSGKTLPVSEAMQRIHELPTQNERRALHEATMRSLSSLADIAESEINAIVTDKKINDGLRGFARPYDETILRYQNEPKSVDALVGAVTRRFNISHRFYHLKAKLLRLEKLGYFDRAVGIGKNVRPVPFAEAVETLRRIFGSVDPRYAAILDSFLEKGQIDAFPKIGKGGGAYCAGNANMPTFVLLNYTNTMDDVMTFAHEMGHAIHTELSKSQPIIYQDYSSSTAEAASTLFESLVFDALFEKLSPDEQVIALHKRLNDDIQTIFRQIAAFNFETELHGAVRAKGSLTRDEIGALLNKHMAAYLGPVVAMEPVDGNHFVAWMHLRRFFYVYTYAFGQLVSKVLAARYKTDRKAARNIAAFLSAGGSESPEEILKSIGIDIAKPDFWDAGLDSIECDIDRLEKLTAAR